MTRWFHLIRRSAAACLLAGVSVCFAAETPVTDQALAPLTSAYLRAVMPGEQAELHGELIATVLRRVARSYASEVDLPKLVAAALKSLESIGASGGEPAEVFRKTVNAALASLDPYSRYLVPRAQSNERSAITGTFGGLGLQVEMADGLVRVVSVMPDTPAARARLKPGDLIVAFDDQPVQGMTLSDAISRMRGQPGSPIALMIRRGGSQEETTISVVRATIRTQPLRWSMHGDVLVLRLASFAGSASSAVEKAIEQANAVRAPRAVVLDMRGNPGGLFREAVLTADAFLSEGEIVSLRGRSAGNARSWQADPAELLGGAPMVVLIDRRSASAAELVAAALQGNGRAIVMGQRSFGKGSVQSTVSLGPDRGALRLTTAHYQGPFGRLVHRIGVGPDIELVGGPGEPGQGGAARVSAQDEAQDALPPRVRLEQSRCGGRAQGEVDPALACALAFLEAGEIDSFLAALPAAEAPASH